MTIAEHVDTIQELTVNQRPPIVPEKRKIKYVDKIVEIKVPVKDEQCVQAYEELRQKTLQCAYNLQACQATSEVYSRLKSKDKQDGK